MVVSLRCSRDCDVTLLPLLWHFLTVMIVTVQCCHYGGVALLSWLWRHGTVMVWSHIYCCDVTFDTNVTLNLLTCIHDLLYAFIRQCFVSDKLHSIHTFFFLYDFLVYLYDLLDMYTCTLIYFCYRFLSIIFLFIALYRLHLARVSLCYCVT